MAAQKHNIFHYLFTIFYILFTSLISSFVWIFVILAGYLIYQTIRNPFDIVLGIPLMLIGGGLLINKLGDVVNSIFSQAYNKGVCIFCSK